MRKVTHCDIFLNMLKIVFLINFLSLSTLKGLSHEIDFKTFDKNLQNLA